MHIEKTRYCNAVPLNGFWHTFFLFSFVLFALCTLSSQSASAQDVAQSASTAPTPAQCGIPGHHALLERMTAAFDLTCPQELKIEPLLHEEESVSKPLEAFPAFAPDEKKVVMQELKVAARKRILQELTPEQQAKMDREIDTVSKGGEGLQKGNGSGGGGHKRNAEAAPVDPFQAEETLSQAIQKYSAFSDVEKKDLIVKVKQASLRSDAPQMTPEQKTRVGADLKQMSM
jgi:Spy/CpxP family protein refolding chaperone